MTEETTTEQLAEIDGQPEDTPTTEYTPPEGWRVLAVGEVLRDGDMTVRKDGYCYSTERVGGWVGSNQRYIRVIEPDKTQELPKYTSPEGWRVVRFGEELLPGDMWVNWEGTEARPDILHGDGATASGGRYIRRIKPEPEPQAEQIEELRSEVSYVQNLLGESRQRVTQLEELVSSLRNINEAQEKAFEAAGRENTAMRNQLAAVKAELASVAADRYRLQVELDAAQQVPADSPELRQLRADLADVTRERDQYRHCYDEVSSHLETIEKTAKAEAVEAIVEWLQAFRGCNSPALALLLLEALPSIMRSLTGLNDEEIE